MPSPNANESVGAPLRLRPNMPTVVAVHASFAEFDSDAVVPQDGSPGRGLVVIPGAPTLFTLNTQAAANGNLYVSVAATANVTVYLSGVVV